MTEREMRTFGLPEPPADLQAVRDKGGDLWRRCPDDTWINLANSTRAWHKDLTFSTNFRPWPEVLTCGPLREVTREQEERAAALRAALLGPVKITDAVIDAVSDQQEVYGIARDRDRARWIAVKVLLAAGFEVTQ